MQILDFQQSKLQVDIFTRIPQNSHGVGINFTFNNGFGTVQERKFTGAKEIGIIQ